MRSEFASRLIELAEHAASQNEVPIAAMLVKNGEIIAEAFNQTERQNSFLAHAEMICLKSATEKLSTKYLNSTELYVSVEPCKMCLGAAQLSRVAKIHYFLSSDKFGKEGRAYTKTNCIQHQAMDYQKRQEKIMSEFFEKLRRK